MKEILAVYLIICSAVTAGSQKINLNQFQPVQGKTMFQAKVTKRINDGYAIETVIDGKPLRGILFSSKLEDYQTASIPNSSR